MSAVFLSVFTEHDVLGQLFLSSTVKHHFHSNLSPFCSAELLLGSVQFFVGAGMFLWQSPDSPGTEQDIIRAQRTKKIPYHSLIENNCSSLVKQLSMSFLTAIGEKLLEWECCIDSPGAGRGLGAFFKLLWGFSFCRNQAGCHLVNGTV